MCWRFVCAFLKAYKGILNFDLSPAALPLHVAIGARTTSIGMPVAPRVNVYSAGNIFSRRIGWLASKGKRELRGLTGSRRE